MNDNEQGEPTKTQVLAALNAYDPQHASDDIDDYSWEHIEDMTNAIRAALASASDAWEYGLRLNQTGTLDRVIPDSPKGLYGPERGVRVRRRKAGSWIPVEVQS